MLLGLKLSPDHVQLGTGEGAVGYASRDVIERFF